MNHQEGPSSIAYGGQSLHQLVQTLYTANITLHAFDTHHNVVVSDAG